MKEITGLNDDQVTEVLEQLEGLMTADAKSRVDSAYYPESNEGSWSGNHGGPVVHDRNKQNKYE